MNIACYILGALVSPGLFYAGAGAVSIPIIIHLLARRRFKKIRWAAIEFLLQAERRNRRRINLQQLILLILRCLIIFLLGLMLARPFVSPSAIAGWLGAESRTHRVFLLDDSFSMSYTASARNTFDQARESLLAILEDLHTRAPEGPVTILKSSDPDAPLIHTPGLDGDSAREIREAVQQLQPSSIAADFSQIMVGLRTQLLVDSDPLNIAVYMISDFQKHDWLTGTQDTPDSPLNVFAEWPEAQRNLSLTLVQSAEEPRSNLAVTQLLNRQARIVATIESAMEARVHNFAEQHSEPFEMEVFLEDAAQLPVHVPAIPPGGSTKVVFNLTFPVHAYQAVHVRIPADGLSLDNQRFAAFEAESAIRVLLVNGEPDVSSLQDEVALLKTALHPEGEVYSGFQVSVVDEAQLDSVDLSSYHVVMLANVYRINDETAGGLEEFVTSGGGLAIFAGDQLDAALYSERLFKDGAGLLPCRITGKINAPRGTTLPSLHTMDAEHALVRIFAGEQNPFLSGLGFEGYIECTPELADEPDPQKNPAHVIAAFTDSNQHPAIIEKTFGQGKVVLFASSADLEWNNWGKQPSYVVVMQELGQYLARHDPTAGSLLAGQKLQCRLDGQRYLRQARLRTPGYPSRPQTPVQLQEVGDELQLEWSDTRETGLYRLLLQEHAGGEQEMILAVNADVRESNLTSCTQSDLQRAAPDIAFTYVTTADALTERSMEAQREFWPVLLIAVLATLMVEQALACWFGRSR